MVEMDELLDLVVTEGVSDLHLDTTPRSPSWPTATGKPTSDGLSRSSTETKNASIST